MTESSAPLPFGPLKRFGLFGGSFDPVHVGHLSIAQQILNALKLEQVVLLPAATAPHKQGEGSRASAEDRMEMCRLGVYNVLGWAASDFEIARGRGEGPARRRELHADSQPACQERKNPRLSARGRGRVHSKEGPVRRAKKVAVRGGPERSRHEPKHVNR